MASAIRAALARARRLAARLPARRRRDRAHRRRARRRFRPTSSFTSCTAASSPPRSARRSRRRRRASASSSLRPASPRPASRSKTCASWSTAALRGARATTAAPGLTRLVTERASRAAVTQRAGRAARQAPGVAIRLWEEAATASLPAHDPPEILEADLSSLLLTCLLWGEADPRAPALPRSAAALRRSTKRAGGWRASARSTHDGRVTDHGRAIAALPLEPRLAHMLHRRASARLRRGGGRRRGAADRARPRRQRSRPGAALAPLALGQVAARRGGAEAGCEIGAADSRVRRTDQRARRAWRRRSPSPFPTASPAAATRPARAWQSVGGRGFRLDPASSLAGSAWLAVGEVAGHASGARILSAAAIDEARRARAVRRSDRDPPRRRLRSGDRLGDADAQPPPRRDPALERPRPNARPGGDRAGAARGRPRTWPRPASVGRPRAPAARIAPPSRTAFDPAIPSLDDEMLARARSTNGSRRCSPASAASATSRRQRSTSALEAAARLRRGCAQLDRLAPAEFVSPAGSRHPIDYSAPAGPTVEVRAQALFGLSQPSDDRERPGAADPRDHLARRAGRSRPPRTCPASGPGSWRDVAKDMRGRYPKHPWPDDPASAAPTLRSKRAAS